MADMKILPPPNNEEAVYAQFVLGRGFVSALIGWKGSGGRNGLSHTDICLPDGRLLGARSDVIQGIAPGVQIRPSQYETWKRQLLYEIPCSKQQREDFYGYALEQRYKPYDHLAIIAFALNRDWRDDAAWYCAELVMACAEHADLFKGHDPYLASNKVDPVMAADELSRIGRKILDVRLGQVEFDAYGLFGTIILPSLSGAV